MNAKLFAISHDPGTYKGQVSRLKLFELTFVKILDLKVAVSLAVHLKVALRISL